MPDNISNTQPNTTIKEPLAEPMPMSTKTEDIHNSVDMHSIIFGSTAPKRSLDAFMDDNNKVTVKTEDGFEIKFSGEREEWTIKSPENKTTTIWGDPHVVESDGDKWDFVENSSFKFGENKVTVETIKNEHGASYSKTVTVYGKTDRFTITGIDKNAPELLRWTTDSAKHDAKLADGDVYQLTIAEDGSDEWEKQV